MAVFTMIHRWAPLSAVVLKLSTAVSTTPSVCSASRYVIQYMPVAVYLVDQELSYVDLPCSGPGSKLHTLVVYSISGQLAVSTLLGLFSRAQSHWKHGKVCTGAGDFDTDQSAEPSQAEGA